MTLIRRGREPNPLRGFRVDPATIRTVGKDLKRPECILAERDGTLWSADARGGVMRIDPDGTQNLIMQVPDPHFDLAAAPAASLLTGTLPNGLAFASNGDMLISNFGTDRLERMSRTGEMSVVLDNIDGRPLGKVNFVLRDRQERIWITVSTLINPWSEAIRPGLADGALILLAEGHARVVAEGFHFLNEIRFDAEEQWLYAAETTAKRITRMRVRPDGSLTDREVFGPSSLGEGLVDGICFDAYGNLWATMIFADRLVAITPDGELLELLNDGNPQGTALVEAAFASGAPVPFDTLMKSGGNLCPWLASLTFGGADLRTVHLGGLRSTTIPIFTSPVAGLPMVHW